MTIDLKAIRRAAEQTPAQTAAHMGFAPPNGRITVAQIEARQDWLLSTISSYIAALGGSAVLVVDVNGQQLQFEI